MLQSFLDMASTRQKLIAGNVANVSTPGYRSRDIDFHGELKKVTGDKKHLGGKVTHPGHLPIGHSKDKGPEILVNRSKDSNGINNVNIDKEVANLAQNQIYYSIGAKLLANKFQGIKNAIRSE
jgi:flagellar basal-body rod protein FlgB